MVKRGKDVSPEYELESFLKTFTTSSDRVRRLMIAAAVASILIFTAFWNLYGSAWHDARTRMVAQGVAAKIGSHKPPTDS